MAESLVIDHNLSLMAVDKSNNSTKAVMLNGAFDRAEIDVSREEVWSFGQHNVEIISCLLLGY